LPPNIKNHHSVIAGKSHERLIKLLRLFNSVIKFSMAGLICAISWKRLSGICLIGSNYGKKRSDNAVALYRYIKARRRHRVYFIENVPEGHQALKRGSIKSFFYFLNADGVFFSHSLSDILPEFHRVPFLHGWLKRPIKIFIQHGVTAVTGLKKVDVYLQRNIAAADVVIATSEAEKELLLELGVKGSKIVITGFPVHDCANFQLREKKILLFFTWKKGPSSANREFEVVNDASILSLIQDCAFDLTVHHHDMSPEPNYRITSNGEKVSDHGTLKEAIDEARILITDNSSVAWEFFYCGCDVLFYKPNQRSRVDLRQAGFHVANNAKELSELLALAIQNKLPETNTQIPFSFKDRSNCERVYNLIQ
jgi:CDP-glycerol glycerophosphotransferase (TagB/SpsB family)